MVIKERFDTIEVTRYIIPRHDGDGDGRFGGEEYSVVIKCACQ